MKDIVDLQKVNDVLNIDGRTKKQKNAVFNSIMNATDKYNRSVVGDHGPRLAGPMFSVGSADGDDIRVLGYARRPDGMLIDEVDASRVNSGLMEDSVNKGLKLKEVVGNIVPNLVVPEAKHEWAKGATDEAKRLVSTIKVSGEFTGDLHPENKASVTGGEYSQNTHTMRIAMDDAIDEVSNVISHEVNHGLEKDYYDWDVAYGDNSNEYVSQIAGSRNRYDKELINEVHQFIGFKDGKFNIDPAKEFIRRRQVENSNKHIAKMDKKSLDSYIDKLNNEAARLNKKYSKDSRFRKKINTAHGYVPKSKITEDSSFFDDLASLFD